MNVIEFQKSLKPDDFVAVEKDREIYINLNPNTCYKFLEFKECDVSCKDCKGKYILEDIYNKILIRAQCNQDVPSYLYKMEEFITEEEFSV